MNDPNGPIYYNRCYHLFYQLHPFSDTDGPKYWGHVRSPDLAHWEQLPIALCPSNDQGEQGVWSGCCTINGLGQPMIFYTSVAPDKSPQTHSEQWAAIGDKDLIAWRKLPGNPVLSEALHGGRKVYDWRDPFIFQDGRRTFMVVGGNLNEARGGQAVVNLYEARNPEFTKWQYCGILFQLPDADARTAECPNFFKLGDRWVLLVSPYGRPQYYVGNFDPETGRFESRARGTLDCNGQFYAPNTMQLAGGRRILWGWINGFPEGHGWNGCLSQPRLLSLSRDGHLNQEPAPALNKLRGKSLDWQNVTIGETVKLFELPATNAMEIQANIILKTAKQVRLALSSATGGTAPIVITLGAENFSVMDVNGPASKTGKASEFRLRIFMDHSVLEVFVNGETCATKVINPPDGSETLELSAEGGTARARLIEAWPMKTIWK